MNPIVNMERSHGSTPVSARPKKRPLPARIVGSLWSQWRDELTPAGKIVFWGICVTGLGTIELQMPIYQLFFALVALISVAAAAGAFFRPVVEIEAHFPERAAAGQAVTTHVRLKNVRRVPAYDVGANVLGLPETIATNLDENQVPRLGPGEQVVVPVVLTPERRGRFQLPPLRAYSMYPFALGRSGRSSKLLSSLLVTPAFEPLVSLKLPGNHRFHPGGATLTSHVGESPEYIGNREYVPGEPIRRLDFRAWARLGAPVVREYQEEFHSRVALILDTYLPQSKRRGRDSAALEAAISFTAAVASALSGHDGQYVIDLLAVGPHWHAFDPHTLGGRLDDILAHLAETIPARADPIPEFSPQVHDRLRDISTAIVVLLGWSPARKAMLDEISRQGCRIKTVVVVRGREASSIPVDEIPACTILKPEDIERGGLSIY